MPRAVLEVQVHGTVVAQTTPKLARKIARHQEDTRDGCITQEKA